MSPASERIVVWASRKVAEKPEGQIQLKYDCGVWTIEVWDAQKKVTRSLDLPPDEMDQLVIEWPKIRADVEGGRK